VKLSMLGERMGRRQPRIRPSHIPAALDRNSRYYPQTGHVVSGDFLAFFNQKGGLNRFGYPIGEPLVVDGRLVQDFQRTRLIWNVDHPPRQRVTLEPIGHTYFEVQGLESSLLAPIPCPTDASIIE
jgi:hypothetical protein